jgi:hypothetical protein
MISSSMPRDGVQRWLLIVLILPAFVAAGETRVNWSGHVKVRALADTYPDNSVFRGLLGASSFDGESDLRLNLAVDRGRWTFAGDYQAFAVAGDSQELSGTPLLPGVLLRLPDDRRRLMDLSRTITADENFALVHRLDRAWLGFTGEKTVLRIGRQAITWGGGLFFSPLDIVNPFDPATIDTEYKTGDDMFYGQVLRDNGDDLQFAYVARRELLTGDVTGDVATTAVKYHGITGDSEYDVLLARNYARTTVGISANRGIGGAILRADIVVADADDWTMELTTNLSYSWVWLGKNFSGAIEYYFNGYGQKNGRYDALSLADNPVLLERLARGETFSLARNYIAAGVTIELTPLWIVTPNLYANIDDPSALLQFVAQHSLGDNLTFLGALNVTVGPDGSEYGGIESPVDGQYFSRGAGLFAQLAWYF